MPRREFSPDKHTWKPSVLPGQVVLLTTVDAAGQANVAPKSWITLASFSGPHLAVGCNTSHTTFQNLSQIPEFVVNLPGEEMAEKVWECIRAHGEARLERLGVTLERAQKVRPPLLGGCRAFLECAYEGHQAWGEEVLLFGRIVAASAEEEVLEGTSQEQYARLRPFFFLEGGLYAGLGAPRRIGA